MKKILFLLFISSNIFAQSLNYSPPAWLKISVTGETIKAIGPANADKFIFGSNGLKVGEYNSSGKLYGWKSIGINSGFADYTYQTTMGYNFVVGGKAAFGYHTNMPTLEKSGSYFLDIAKQNSNDISRIRFTKYEASGIANVSNWYLEHGSNNDFSIKKVGAGVVDSTSSFYINNGKFSFGRSTPINSSKLSIQGSMYATENITTPLNVSANSVYTNNFIMNYGSASNKILTSDVNGVGTWENNKAVTNLSQSGGSFSWSENGSFSATPAFLSQSTAASTYAPLSNTYFSDAIYIKEASESGLLKFRSSLNVGSNSRSFSISNSVGLGLAIKSSETPTGNTDVNRFVIDKDGDVGIGIDDPQYKLDVYGYGKLLALYLGTNPTDVQTQIDNRLSTATATSTYIPFSGGRFVGDVQFSNSSSTSAFSSLGTTWSGTGNLAILRFNYQTKVGGNTVNWNPLRFDSNGYVGIGKDPSFALDVLGASNFSNSVNFSTNITVGSSIQTPIIVGGTGTTSSLIHKTTTGVGTMGADHIFQVGNNGATEAMRILNNGNVGIGTTSPNYKLHLYGSGTVSSSTESTNGAALSILSGTYGQIYNVTGDFYLSNGSASSSLFLQTNSIERMKIDNTGNVSIGTATTSNRLRVLAASGEYGAYFLGNGSAGGHYGVLIDAGSTSSDYSLRVRSSGTSEYFAVRGDGNVGVGTATPSQRLDVNGNAKVYNSSGGGAYYSSTTAADAAARNWVMRGNSIVYGDFDIRQSGSLGGDPIAAGNSRFYINPTGNIGIGTTSPDVFSRSYSGKIVGISSTGQSSLGINSATGNGAYFDMGVNNERTFNIYSDATSSDVATFGSRNLTLSTNGSTRVSILSNGNVGIGTDSPNSQLQLANTVANKKITIYEDANDQHKFYGFGINSSMLRYQVAGISASHGFYAATSSTTSSELFKINGNGTVQYKLLTTTEINAIASPVEGMEAWNTTLKLKCTYNGTNWKRPDGTTNM